MKLFLLSSLLLLMFASAIEPNHLEDKLLGSWKRTSDGLIIHISGQISSDEGASASVADQGDWQFDCSFPSKPFYKNFKKLGKETWSCDFLIYDIPTYRSHYSQSGRVRINKDNELEIVCPGFPTRYFTRLEPRFEPN